MTTTTAEQVEEQGLDVEQLELSLGMFEIQLEQKLKQLRQQFAQPSFQIDLTKLYYDHVGSTELKFKELMTELHTFLIKQQQSATPNLRSTFFRILENPLFALFKTSKFELFDLSLNGFDIEIEPLDALKEVYGRLVVRIQQYRTLLEKGLDVNLAELDRKLFRSEQALLLYSVLHSIEFKIFTLYSYLRKGAQLLRKTFESRLAVTEMFNTIEKELVPLFVQQSFVRGIKEVSTLNFEIYNIEPTYDYFFFYFSVPLAAKFLPVFLDINIVADRCHRSNNYNPFVQFFLKHHHGLRDRLQSVLLGDEWVPHVNTMIAGALRFLRAEVLLFEEFVQVVELLLLQSERHPSILEGFLKFQPDKDVQSLREIHNHYLEVVKAQPQLVSTLRTLPFEKVRERLEAVQRRCLFGLDYTTLPLTKVQELHEIMGGMPASYFEFVESRLKQLNSTASLTNKHKYIASQFNIVEVTKLAEALKEINNFMYLGEAYTKEYDQLFESKLNPRYFFDLLGIVMDNAKELHGKPGVETFITNVFKLFQRVKQLKDGLSPFQQIKYYRILSHASTILVDPLKHQTFCTAVLAELNKDRGNMTIKDYIGLAANLRSSTFDPVDELIYTLLAELHVINQKVTKQRFHEMALDAAANEVLTEDEAKFIKQNFEIVNDELVAKDIGIFKLSNQDQTTNPLNLDSRIDEVYLSLTANTKRVLQITVLELLNEVVRHVQEAQTAQVFHSRSNFIVNMLAKSCKEYPVVVPYLLSLKVNLRDLKAELSKKSSDVAAVLPDSATFAEFLTFCNVMDLHACRDLLQQVLHRKEIKYINGHDYVRQEIATAVLEASIKLVNHLRSKKHIGDSLTSSLDILVSTIEIQRKLTKGHMDLVRNLVEVSKELISSTGSLSNMFHLSHIYRRLVVLYFKGKEQELRNGISKQYHIHRLEPIRNFDPKDLGQISFGKVDKLANQTTLTFGVNFDFEIESSTLDKTTNSAILKKPSVPFSEVRKHLSSSEKHSPVKQQQQVTGEPSKELDLRGGKYNMLFQLGEANVRKVSDKSSFLFKFTNDNVFPNGEDASVRAYEVQNIALFYLKDVAFPPIKEQLVEEAVLSLLASDRPLEFMRNPTSFAKIIDLLSIVLLRDSWQFKGESPLAKYLQSIGEDKQKQFALINKILHIFSHFGYSNLWVCSYDDLAKHRLKLADIWLKDSKLPSKQSLLCLFLKYTLNKYVDKQFSDFKEFSNFLKQFFERRPESNTALTYKIPVDKQLLNLMLKCIDFQNLHYASILFYANFENLRLYTEDIQEGFKALNLASKTRSYNEFLKLSKEYNDQEYLTPLRIFKENLKFFVKVEKEGYVFKRREEQAIVVDKLVNIFKSNPKEPAVEADKVLEAYLHEVDKLRVNTVNRVKTMYMASKLRDLSIQNGQTISLLYDILSSGGLAKETIVTEISRIEIFSILTMLQYELLQFEHSSLVTTKYQSYSLADDRYLTESLTYPTTRRFGFNMSTSAQKCEFEFDDVLQLALVNGKEFLSSEIGKEWALQHLRINPAFYTENRINNESRRLELLDNIRRGVEHPESKPSKLVVRSASLFEDLKGQLSLLSSSLLHPGLEVELDGRKTTLDTLTQQLVGVLSTRQILVKAGKYLVFNRYKFSEDSLDLVQILGSLLAACIYRGLRVDIPLHNSLISLVRSSMVDFDDLVDVDFKSWQTLKAVLTETDCKTLNLTFSYEFDSAREPGKKQRLELIDKGTSKKVNNLNREEYCDLICCKLLFGFTQLQLDRFQVGLYRVLPKEFLTNTPVSTVMRTIYRQDNPELERSLKLQHLKKFGVSYPELFIGRDCSFQNLRDFVNINWLLSVLAELPQDRLVRFAKILGCELDFLNLKVFTRAGQTETLQLLPEQKIVVTHFSSKERMHQQLIRLIS